jgi:hypothetical protein
MNSPHEQQEGKMSTQLWCVNINGPDDLIPTSSRDEAIRLAAKFNHWWIEQVFTKGLHDNDPVLWAVPTVWPHDDPGSHAEWLAKPSAEYAWLTHAEAAR